MRKVGELLLASNRNAAIAAFLCTLMPLIKLPGGFFAAIIVALVTLQKGFKAGLIILAWVALPAVSLLFLHRWGVFDVLLVRCLLVWLFAGILGSSAGSWRLILEISALLGFFMVVGLHLFIPDLKAWWSQQLTHYFREMGIASAWKLTPEKMNLLINKVAPIATGIVYVVVMMGSLLQLLLARWWQAFLFNPGGLRREFIQIRIGRLLALVAMVVLGGVFLKIDFLMDYTPVMLLPFMVSGLSLLHLFVTLNKSLVFPLILVYIGLLFLPVLVVLLLALAGYVDSWVNLRKKINYPAGSRRA